MRGTVTGGLQRIVLAGVGGRDGVEWAHRSPTLTSMSRTRYRIVLGLLGVTFIVIVVGSVLILPEGTPTSLPGPVRELSPRDGDLVLRQAKIEFRTDPAYRASFVIDGVSIPDDEVITMAGTGIHVYQPGPGKTIEEWTPGFHVVEAAWDTVSGLPDPGSITWSFRVQ